MIFTTDLYNELLVKMRMILTDSSLYDMLVKKCASLFLHACFLRVDDRWGPQAHVSPSLRWRMTSPGVAVWHSGPTLFTLKGALHITYWASNSLLRAAALNPEITLYYNTPEKIPHKHSHVFI